MATEVTLDGTVYRRINDTWYNTDSFIRVPQTIARKLDVRLLRTTNTAPDPEPRSRKKKKSKTGKNNVRGFRQEDVLPLIADLIRNRTAETNNPITHHDLVDALLAHPKGRELTEAAVERKGHSVRRWAAWMIQAFSQRMSAGDSPYQDEFTRERVDGAWAYNAK
ncbi:MAG: hypothetical protein ACOC8X_06320 [Chloroflexota bacterium]